MNEISDDISMAPETMDMGGALALALLLLPFIALHARTTWKPVRWTLALTPTETNHLKSPRPCQSRNIAEPAANSPVLQHGFPRDVTQLRREKFPEQHVETHVETKPKQQPA